MKGIQAYFALALLGTATSFLAPISVSAQTGKIAGQVTDASTGASLPGVNVVIEGTTRGAATDRSGFYVIVNVRSIPVCVAFLTGCILLKEVNRLFKRVALSGM